MEVFTENNVAKTEPNKRIFIALFLARKIRSGKVNFPLNVKFEQIMIKKSRDKIMSKVENIETQCNVNFNITHSKSVDNESQCSCIIY
jgi:hypothetical protein